MKEQKVQTLHNNSLEIFKQGQALEIQLLKTGICQECVKMPTTSLILKPLLSNSGNEKVTTDNFTRLTQIGEPIVQISVYHTNPKAKHLSVEDMCGLEPITY